MRWVLTLLVLIGAVGVVGDAVARGIAEDRAADAVAASLDGTGQVDVSIGGWPFLPSALSGDLDEIRITSRRFISHGVALQDLDVVLQDVTVRFSDLLSDADAATASRGRGTAVLTSRGLRAAVEENSPDVVATLRGGEVIVQHPVAGETTGNLMLEGDVLVISAPGLPGDVRVQMPALVQGLRYRSVEVRGSEAHFSFDLRNASLRA